jgi:hypothetical protein
VIVAGGTAYANTDNVSASTVNIGPGSSFSIAVATVGVQYGVGVQATYPVTEPVLTNNYFEGWTCGIYSRGGSYLKLIGNDFGPNSTDWEWTYYNKATSLPARLWNQSFAESYAGAGAPVGGVNYPMDNHSACTVMSGPGQTYVDNATIQAGLGFQELLRSYIMGSIQPVTFSAGNFGGNGSLTWTVSSGGQTTYCWSIVNKTLTVWFTISGTLGGSASAALTIAIPGSFTSSALVVNPVLTNNGGTLALGYAEVTAAGSLINIYNNASGTNNWGTSGTAVVYGSIQIPVN